MVVIYYVVVMGLQGSMNIEVKQFDNVTSCEIFMHKNHNLLAKEYYKATEQRMTGSGCRIKQPEFVESVNKTEQKGER